MGWRTSAAAIALRNWARRTGLTRLGRHLGRRARGYEEKFDAALLARVRPGDCVWDVGANVGHYTEKFIARCGAGGRVVAFEPGPASGERLKSQLAGRANLIIRAEALGAEPGTASFVEGDDPLGATSFVTTGSPAEGAATVAVAVARGDDLVTGGEVPAPNLVKIDTEGFELEIIRGMAAILRSADLHTVGIEVHFGLLARRGMGDAPRLLERALDDGGFRTRWVDASHLIATRPLPGSTG